MFQSLCQRLFASITALLLILTLSTSAAAQSAPPAAAAPSAPAKHSITLTGSFGYLFAQTTGDGGDKLPAGWVATIEGVFDGKYAAVVEFAGNYSGDDHIYRTNLGGARFILPKQGIVTPFVQLLAGKGRSSAVGDEVSAFTLQPGAGVDLHVVPHIGIRLQGDYDWRHRDTGNVNGYRFAASIVIR